MGQIEKPTLLKEQISDVTLQIKQLKEGIELKPGTEVVYNNKGNKATIIAFNKKDPKKGVENDYYVLNDKSKLDSKNFIMIPSLLKSRNKIRDNNAIDILEKKLIQLEKLDTKGREEPVRNLAAEKNVSE